MFKRLAALLTAVFVICTPAFAAEKQYNVVSNGKALEEKAFQGEACVMVPLRAVAEALGYTVEWDGETQTAAAEDSIQKVRVRENDAVAVFTGKLQIIDLSHDLEMKEKAVILDGRTYVPAEMFADFFNDVEQVKNEIRISPQMCELD